MNGDKRPWYFLHIPKTAGTTFRVLLENRFHLDDICPAYEFFQIKSYTREQLACFRLFRGHMGYNLVNYLPQKPRVMVMLRDPMERAVSHFEYIRRDPGHPKHRILHERNMGLQAYLLDPVLSAEVTNAQVRPLAHLATRSVLRKLLDDSDSQEDFARAWRHHEGVLPTDDELLDIALQRLENLDFVGVAEKLEQGMELAAWLLQAPAPEQLQSLNINPGRTRLESLTDDVLDLLKQLTSLDRRLYERGRELFEQQYRRMRIDAGSGAARRQCAAASTAADGKLVVDFVQPLCGSGWHQRELAPGKGILRWTGPGDYSEVAVRLQPGQGYQMMIHLADRVNEAVLRSLQLTVNRQVLPFVLTEREGEMLVLADIPASLVRLEGMPSRIGLKLAHTQMQSDGGDEAIDHSHARKVGIAVYRFEFMPK